MLSHSLSFPCTTTTTPSLHHHHHHHHRPSLPFIRRNPSLRLPLPFPPRATSSLRTPISEDETAAKFLDSVSVTDFMRFKGGDNGEGEGEGELQTAVVGYRKRFPWSILRPFLQVDLVSTIHIADKEYFATLQKILESCDCVLYEMVVGREGLENDKRFAGARRLKSSRTQGFTILGFIQRQLARILMLEFQLDGLDFDAENFYHADLDFETFQSLQLKRGESLLTFATDMTIRSAKDYMQPASESKNLGSWRSNLLWASRVLPMPLVGLVLIKGVCADPGERVSDYPEFKALSRLDLVTALKFFMAKRLIASEFTEVSADEAKTVIIGERNKAATEALRSAIDAGNNKIAILYGGGHMPDLGQRLREEFDLVPSTVQWIPAWSIRKRDLDSSSFPFLKKMAEFSGWPLNRYQTLALLIFSSVLALDLWFWELFLGNAVNWTSRIASDVIQFTTSLWLI